MKALKPRRKTGTKNISKTEFLFLILSTFISQPHSYTATLPRSKSSKQLLKGRQLNLWDMNVDKNPGQHRERHHCPQTWRSRKGLAWIPRSSERSIYFSIYKMERIIIRFYKSWLIGSLLQIGIRTLGHIQIYLVVSMALKQNPSIIIVEEDVFHCGILVEDKCSWKQMLRLTGTSPNEMQVCQAQPFN